jgi:methyl-accepting chemotaxis protein
MNTKSSEKGYKRRQYLVNTPNQLHLLGWIFLITIAVVATISFAILCYVFNLCSAQTVGSLDETMYQSTGIRPCPIIILVIFWLFLTYIAWYAFRLTHRIAGPIYKFRSVVQSIAKGDYDIPVIHLRKRDEFKELADDLNYMMDNLKNRNTQIRETAKKIAGNLDKLSQKLNEKEMDNQTREYIAKIQQDCKEL